MTTKELAVRYVGNASQLQKTVSSVDQQHKKLGESFKKVGAIIGASLSAAAVFQFGKTSLEVFDTLQKNIDRLDVGMKKIGQGSETAGIVSWARSFSMQTGIAEAAVVDMSSKLAGMGSHFFKALGPGAETAVQTLTSGLLDMSAATGKSASMLMRSLGPAILNTPAKAISSLQKYGALTDAQVKRVTALTKAGKNQAATQILIGAIYTKFTGTAAATATPMEKLANLWNQIEIAAGAALTPILNGLIAVTGWLERNASMVKTVLEVFVPLVTAYILYSKAAKIATAATALWNAVLDANPIGLVVLAVGILAVVIIRNWAKIKAATIAVWNSIRAYVLPVWRAITAAATVAWRILTTIAKAIFTVYATEFKLILGAATTVWHGILTAFNAIKGPLVAAWHTVGHAVSGVWNGIMSTVKTVLNAIISIWDNTIGKLAHGQSIGLGPVHVTLPNLYVPQLDTGGLVMRTGLALVHEGETFSGVGTHRSNLGTTINVTVNVAGSVATVDDMAQQIRRSLIRAARNNSGKVGLA